MADDERSLIQKYFHLGYENEVTLQFVVDYHSIKISLSTLKCRLRDYGLKRRRNEVDVDQLRDIIRNEISGSGESLGYRAVWHFLRLVHEIYVPRHLVATILQEVDPVGVQERRRRRLSQRKYLSCGPNFSWHVDGNGGCPILLRTDCGTENGVMAAMQCYFRQNGEDAFSGERAHKYGSSPANQRIKAWWSYFRKGRAGWWIDFFKDMVNAGVSDVGNVMQMEALWFSFEAVIQNELDNVKQHWNTHRIRRSGHGTVPGVPDVLFYLPQRSDAFECKQAVENPNLQEMEQHLLHTQPSDDEGDLYQEYFDYVVDHEALQIPSSMKEAFNFNN
ncbi:hypothetical protein AWC38_SpisGene19588 [Stylophora pistillata]|uniref:Integrase core domain-containing protein n=1 Tax=Stylophora pistillata TaxID=50429 RepID=A0A2B4RI49_STYPI|nr:hypothetical protein AWC38_SpisGene19588 [Stylophora pistillata]